MQAGSGIRSRNAQKADGGQQRVGYHVMHEQRRIVDIRDRVAGQRANTLCRREQQPENGQPRKCGCKSSRALNHLVAERQADPDQ